MSPTTRAAIDAAEDLAWRPTSNIIHGYAERNESAARFKALTMQVRLSANASPELRLLVEAMRRAAGQSYANRQGIAYYDRKHAIYELRGALDVWKRSVAA